MEIMGLQMIRDYRMLHKTFTRDIYDAETLVNARVFRYVDIEWE